MVNSSHIIRELTRYMSDHRSEIDILLPLFDSLKEHVQAGRCPHRDGCPSVKAGAVVVDERGQALFFWTGTGWGFPEVPPHRSDSTLGFTALRAVMEQTGIFDVWPVEGVEHPLVIDVDSAGPHDGPAAVKFGFRYVYRTDSAFLAPVMGRLGVEWRPVSEIQSPRLRHRVLNSIHFQRS
ncbi:NUDIX hydrolase [Streptomyces sp. 796.1]|uniref:NUDIX hydrolase n=1 Tax=Streptomyces sp. 796.1 TaxID=3163029 RepID=UPI0039C9D99C